MRRWTSTAAGRGTQVSPGLSWKTGHVVGALAVAISAGYALGVYNSGSASLGLLSHKHEVSPVYGSIKDFERVNTLPSSLDMRFFFFTTMADLFNSIRR